MDNCVIIAKRSVKINTPFGIAQLLNKFLSGRFGINCGSFCAKTFVNIIFVKTCAQFERDKITFATIPFETLLKKISEHI